MRLSTLFVVNRTEVLALIMAVVASVTYVMSATAADVKPTVAQKATSLPATPLTRPSWQELSATQKIALAPLAPEWQRMSEQNKKKWLEIANKYAVMKPDEQVRVQERMRAWVKLTPEQRMQARENFARTTQINSEKKSEQWQQYQKLSEEEKKKLASEAVKKKSVTNLPSEAQRKAVPLAPIKGAPKAALAAQANKPVAVIALQSASLPASVLPAPNTSVYQTPAK
ncbi:DUF3106 domain-containing protein [Undibacterium sp. RTI2.1]|uniref:DUF3106 domain-containing protein n=1 Tax=unclassified Undibacterium TaxID=2630295 RepID=UPI002B228FD5|nr:MULTISPECIES: DUF3106 domain-containing protein [unclassified Undibacterium]MEB0030023.1 DUF3106 domain-containing protein [Undibacterium sp. RTI2.1]MEB0114926.1 DUF3106 domain-containing protein [Undibacterium sp. RTI2.2]